jgi:transposase
MTRTGTIPNNGPEDLRVLPGAPVLHPAIAGTNGRQQSTVLRRAGKQLSDVQCGRIYAYLEFNWKPSAIARKLGVSEAVIHRMEQNLRTYGSIRPPQLHSRGRPYKMTLADEDALLQYLLAFGWRTQDEMVFWLAEEKNVIVDRTSISRMLSRRKWNQKTLRQLSMTRSEDLRDAYLRDMSQFDDTALVFLDESIFNEKTGWRHRAYAPVGHEARYVQSVRRGDTFSIVAATTLDGWLPCTAVKKGYFSTAQFLDWLYNHLVPTLRTRFIGRQAVIVMDNCSIHTNRVIEDTLKDLGFIVRYLPPYSPDFNPIELCFSVLKAWIRRNWVQLREEFAKFEDFLWFAIQHSHCDQHIQKQFRHAAGGVYTDGNTCREFYRFLDRWEKPQSNSDMVI